MNQTVNPFECPITFGDRETREKYNRVIAEARNSLHARARAAGKPLYEVAPRMSIRRPNGTFAAAGESVTAKDFEPTKNRSAEQLLEDAVLRGYVIEGLPNLSEPPTTS